MAVNAGRKKQGLREAVLAGVFTLSTGMPAFADDALKTEPEIPATVRNFYIGDFYATSCTFIDGSGTTSPALKARMQGLRGFMEQYPIGRMIVNDLKKERILLCFEDKILSPDGKSEQGAVYEPKENFIRFSLPHSIPQEKLAANLAHEWDHKNDRIMFADFTYRPWDASTLYRFSECGAFAFQAMAMHEAKKAGVAKNDFFENGSLVWNVYNAYERGLKANVEGNNGQERAWRGALDACFAAPFKFKNTDMMTEVYRLALSYPIARKSDFAMQRVTNSMLDEVVCPAGAEEGILRRTGNGDVVSSAFYAGVRPDQAEKLKKLEQDILSHAARLADSSAPQLEQP